MTTADGKSLKAMAKDERKVERRLENRMVWL
jgi:hypothetical protein